jgi:hypothetical protein
LKTSNLVLHNIARRLMVFGGAALVITGIIALASAQGVPAVVGDHFARPGEVATWLEGTAALSLLLVACGAAISWWWPRS